ncbi:hypothetical protein PMAC_002723 [Pneumocystis sp. 'macacae']|nr:hypothetical protein PMAC_002723 [Pneumocystis sp. 'macacae']
MKKRDSLSEKIHCFYERTDGQRPHFSSSNVAHLFLRNFLPCIAVFSSEDADGVAIAKGYKCLREMLSVFGEDGSDELVEDSLLGIRFMPLERPASSLEGQLGWIEECIAYHVDLLEKSLEIRTEESPSVSDAMKEEIKENVLIEASVENLEDINVSFKASNLSELLAKDDKVSEELIKDLTLDKKFANCSMQPNTLATDTSSNASFRDFGSKKTSEDDLKTKKTSFWGDIPLKTSLGGSSLDLSSVFDIYFRLLTFLPPSAHESFSHPVACIFAVSSYSPAPLKALELLLEQQSRMSLPPYIDLGYLQTYLFIHDDAHNFEKLSSVEKILQEPRCMKILEQKRLQNIPFSIPEDTQYLFRDYINPSDKYCGLSGEDTSSIRAFVKELISQSILPVMKCSVDIWNEQLVVPRKGFSGRFLSISRRYFGTGLARNSASSHQNGNYDITTSSYPPSSPEAQLRKLADYAFMLHDWKFAQSIYELIKKDFFDDNAWKYYAGAHEMSTFCLLLLPMYSTKIKIETIDSMLDASLYSYLSQCSSPFFALRSIMFASELMALRSNKAKNDAARWLIKILESGIVGNIVGTLLTERIATYFASVEVYGTLKYGSRYKKAAFWKVLSAEAWLLIGKKYLAQQSLKDAMVVYENTQWPGIKTFMDTLLQAAYT